MLLDNALIIFIKYPEPGLVKTRLAKEIGAERAALLYRSFVERILAQTNSPDFNRFIFYHPPDRKSEIIDWLGSSLGLYPQKGDNLGERLSNAFKFLFENGARKIITIGSDSPTIDNRILLRAFNELENNQCVIGPSLDGGYYLLGLNKFYRELFQDIDWSTDRVLKQTIGKLCRLKLRFSLLEKKFDIDTKEDLQYLGLATPTGFEPVPWP